MRKRLFCLILFTALCLGHNTNVSAEPSWKDPFGADFMNGVAFFGESTTVHLRQRSSVPADRVWADRSGTARLDSNLAYRPLTDAKSGQSMTPIELAQRDQPSYLVLSFGLNGIMDFSADPDQYLKKYQKLMDLLSEASPDTCFLIQSVYPVAQKDLQADWRFSVPPDEINEKIDLLNGYLEKHCDTLSNANFIDTSCKLKDPNGFLRRELTTDGIHLNVAAYRLILSSIAEHLGVPYES